MPDANELVVRTGSHTYTLKDALEAKIDILPALKSPQQTAIFRHEKLEARRSQILDVVSRHLNISSTKLVLSQPSEWIHGGFNICLPIDILDTRSQKLPRKAMMRVVLPHAVGESYSSGTVDEKVRCEAATYAWLQRECPDIPIPQLLGIGLPGGRSFSPVETESWLNWTIWQIRRAYKWLQGSTLTRYVAQDRTKLEDLGYLLIEHVEDGKMLSSSWHRHRDNPQKRKNLYSSLANIMLSLANVPLPRIGSWTMDNDGVISLTNRPFTDLTAFWARHEIPVNIPRELTYASTDSYLRDLLSYQDTRMKHQPNAILDRKDGVDQLSSLVALRAIFHQLYNTCLSPQFVMTFSDMHQSNIFVDEDWNITRLIDLEFACSGPIELLNVPSWLSGVGVDQLAQHLEEYKLLYDQFVDAIAKQEVATRQSNALSQRMRDDWASGRLWYSIALGSINAFPALFADHFGPKYFKDWKFSRDAWPLAQLWGENASEFIDEKVEEIKAYNHKVREVFREAAEFQRAAEAERVDAQQDDEKAE